MRLLGFTHLGLIFVCWLRHLYTLDYRWEINTYLRLDIRFLVLLVRVSQWAQNYIMHTLMNFTGFRSLSPSGSFISLQKVLVYHKDPRSLGNGPYLPNSSVYYHFCSDFPYPASFPNFVEWKAPLLVYWRAITYGTIIPFLLYFVNACVHEEGAMPK